LELTVPLLLPVLNDFLLDAVAVPTFELTLGDADLELVEVVKLLFEL
jgi:hypothetical protein